MILTLTLTPSIGDININTHDRWYSYQHSLLAILTLTPSIGDNKIKTTRKSCSWFPRKDVIILQLHYFLLDDKTSTQHPYQANCAIFSKYAISSEVVTSELHYLYHLVPHSQSEYSREGGYHAGTQAHKSSSTRHKMARSDWYKQSTLHEQQVTSISSINTTSRLTWLLARSRLAVFLCLFPAVWREIVVKFTVCWGLGTWSPVLPCTRCITFIPVR